MEEEIASLKLSELTKLKARAEEAASQGRDLLAEMMEDLKGRINVARRRFEIYVSGKGQP